MVNTTSTGTGNRECLQMPEAPNTLGRRKLRCPKCTARLTEPPALIYQCPICSTLLLAKGNHGDTSEKSCENKLRDGYDTESPKGRAKLEKAPATTEKHTENEEVNAKERNRPPRVDPADNTIGSDVLTFAPQNVQSSTLEQQPLYKKNCGLPKGHTEAFTRKVDSLPSDMPPHTLHWRTSACSSVKSFESSDKSEHGRCLSGLKSPSYDGSETESDFPASSSEDSHTVELPETGASISKVEGILFEGESGKAEASVRSEEIESEYDHDQIDSRWDAQPQSNEEVVEFGDSGIKGSVLNDAGELVYDTGICDQVKESFDDLGVSLNDRHPSEVADFRRDDELQASSKEYSVSNDPIDGFGLSLGDRKSSELIASSQIGKSEDAQTESRVFIETVVDLTTSLSALPPLEGADSEHLDRSESSMTDPIDLTMSAEGGGNGTDLEPSRCRKQQFLDGFSRGSVLGDWRLETNPCHSHFSRGRLVNIDTSDSLDLPLHDWQSVQCSKLFASSKEKHLDTDLFDEKRIVELNRAAVDGLLLKDEDNITFSPSHEVPGLSERDVNQKEVSVRAIDSEAYVEKSSTTQEIFQRVKEEPANCDQPNHLLTTHKIDESDLAMVVSNRHEVSVSNLDLTPPSSTEEIDRKPAPPRWNDKPVTARQMYFREDGPFRKGFALQPSQDRAVLQETALAEQNIFPDMSAGNACGHWPRSYHQNFLCSEKMQKNDDEGKISRIVRCQKPTCGQCVENNVADLNPNRKGLYGLQGKCSNPGFCVQCHSQHGIWQEHGTHLQSQNLQLEQNVMEQGSHCLFCRPASTFHGYCGRGDEGIHHFSPSQHYLSDVPSLPSSTVRGMAYPIQVSTHGAMLPSTMHEHAFSQYAHPPVCGCCMQQPQMQQQVPQKPLQRHCAACFAKPASMMTHESEGWECWPHKMLPPSCAHSPVEPCKTSLLSPNIRVHKRSDIQFQPHASLARKQKRYPPLPVKGAAPYVLCQHCDQLLQVPSKLSPNAENIQKLRCGACGKVSRFSMYDQARLQSSLVSSALNTLGQALSISELAEPSTACKEVSTICPPANAPSFLTNEPPQQDASFGVTGYPSGLPSHCVRVQNKQVSSEINANARTMSVIEKVDHGCHATASPVTGAKAGHELSQAQVLYGDGHSSLSGLEMPGEYHCPSSLFSMGVSSPQANASRCQAHEKQNVHFGFHENDRAGSEAPAMSDEHFLKHSSKISNQRRSHQGVGNGVRSAPWSPAPGSPSYDHLVPDTFLDFNDKSQQEERNAETARVNRGRNYFAGLIKRSFKDFAKGNQGNNNRSKVMVNGQLIHMAAVKKAEEQAGSIHPGSYWYDSQAGFWGVMGGPCLGIIPPSIQEFDSPLAKDSSGGRTGVLVNGRELHEKDLEVLARRGLPITPGKAYIVDILGRVDDAASGQRLKSLGKLAPTVQRKGCGYGMFQQYCVQVGSAHSPR